MIKNIYTLVFISFLFFNLNSTAQSSFDLEELKGAEILINANSFQEPCISPIQYTEIEKRCALNIQNLGISKSKFNKQVFTALAWPLKSKDGITDCSYYAISAHVDQDPAIGTFKDYNCGSKTYDGHRGTDIAIFPYPFFKLDNSEVEVIAAAPGMIIDKADGNFDKNCGANNLQANYIVVQHADGSRVLYFHMKKNSLTTKAIGQSVLEGEYLGVVGSSGNSSGPHLHFEVWAGSTVSTLVDPYAGSCNLLNANSWWKTQKPYEEPAVVKTSVNTTDIILPGCPATETTNESSCFTLPFQGLGLPAGFAKFYVFIRNETLGINAEMTITKPDGTVINTWTYNPTSSNKQSYRAWTKVLPTIPGIYYFNAKYNGMTCSSRFDIVKAIVSANGPSEICPGTSLTLTANDAKSYLWSNGDTTKSIIASTVGDYIVTITNTFGCTSISAPFNVKLLPVVNAKINPQGSTTFCIGDQVKLIASGGNSYLWNTGIKAESIVVSNAGNYVVTVTDQNACTASTDIEIFVNAPMNNLKIISKNDSLISPYNEPNIWFLQGNPTPIDTSKMIKCKQAGIYVVSGIDTNGCIAISDTFYSKCKTTTINNLLLNFGVIIYPNPSKGAINIVGIPPDSGKYELQIYDISGNLKLLKTLFAQNAWQENAIDISALNDGIYILHLNNDQLNYTMKLIKLSSFR